ncbi:diguanylate cyclase domain-containing protein [Bhargavaea ullalensis]|uniref:Diguanylate cyclase (GGDEF)-like protein/PAS domain S-box-containing protein n=1 Tax=Bhargavaea ullalensis TaxID=1265685 RepID=A0ABV2GDD7_9BACL
MGESTGSLQERVLMDGLSDMIFVMAIRENGSVIYEFINRAARQALGVQSDIIGRSIAETIGDERGRVLETVYRRVAVAGEPVVYEDCYLAELGGKRHSEASLTPLFEDGKCTHVVAAVRDVTEKFLARQSAELMSGRLELGGSRYRALFENNSDAVFELDEGGRILSANRAAELLFSTRSDALAGNFFTDLVTGGDRPRAADALLNADASGRTDIRLDVRAGDGPVGCLLNFTPVVSAGKRVGCYAHLKDMRELDKLVGQFMESERRFRIIAEHVRDVILVVDEAWDFLYVSPASRKVFGYDPEELARSNGRAHVFPEDERRLRRAFNRAVGGEGTFTLRLRLAHAEKGWIWSELTGSAVFGSDGGFLHMVLVVRDITRQKEAEERLQNYAYHDPLTGLPNRRLFYERLHQRLDRYIKTGEPFAVILMDIDGFKQINDTRGHEAGDEVIRAFGARVAGAVDHGFVARHGGDEFVVLIMECRDEQEAEAVGRKILDTLDFPLPVASQPIRVSTSLGIALAAPGRSTPEALLRLADQAMYQAKKSGRGRLRIL